MVSSNMDDLEDIQTENLDSETQMDATNGRESPVIAQTQKTIERESQRKRSKSRGAIPPRSKRGSAANRGRNPSSSQSVSPERPRSRAGRSGRVSAATNTTSSRSRSRSRSPPPETPVTDSQRGRSGRNDRGPSL